MFPRAAHVWTSCCTSQKRKRVEDNGVGGVATVEQQDGAAEGRNRAKARRFRADLDNGELPEYLATAYKDMLDRTKKPSDQRSTVTDFINTLYDFKLRGRLVLNDQQPKFKEVATRVNKRLSETFHEGELREVVNKIKKTKT